MYCHANNSDNTGLLLLIKGAIGKPRKLYQEDFYANNLPPGHHSTLAVGQIAPPPTSYTTFRSMSVPLGKPEPTKEKVCPVVENEFVIYDVSQAQIEYLVRVKFIDK